MRLKINYGLKGLPTQHNKLEKGDVPDTYSFKYSHVDTLFFLSLLF